jgi:hypothetical protein
LIKTIHEIKPDKISRTVKEEHFEALLLEGTSDIQIV